MHTLTDKLSRLQSLGQQCLEIKLSETCFLVGRNSLRYTLSAYALDGHAFPGDEGTVLYRFMVYDWERTIERLLLSHSVPFEIIRTFSFNVFDNRRKKRIYVAEEELEVLFAINSTLENAGYDVFLSHCARPLMEDGLPDIDLFVFDRFFKDGDGLQIYNHLRSRIASQRTPVIIISSLPSSATIGLGVSGFLQKPFEMQDLLAMVNKYAGPSYNQPEFAGHSL